MSSDYGSDPIGNGMFKMVPSGDVVDLKERNARLANKERPIKNEILGMSWDELEKRQGGKLKRLP
jgi:hypothetical protein